MPEVGIVMTLTDNVSAALKTIAGNAQAFDKDVDELNAGLQRLNEAQGVLAEKQARLTKALEASSLKVADARKEYRKLKDEASKGALDDAIDEQARLQQELKATEAEIRLNNKAYDALGQSAMAAAKGIREAEARSKSAAQGMKEDAWSVSGSMGGETGAFDSLAKGLMASGVLKDLGASVSGFLGMGLTSAIGEPMAQLVSQAVSGAFSGAAAGAFLGPAGAAIGAAIGGAAGGLSGYTAIEQARDDSFKSYVQEGVEGQLEEMDSIQASGSATAGRREQDQMAFTQRFGSEEAAEEYLGRVKTMAVNTNYSYDEITGYSKSLLNTYSPEKTLEVLQDLSDATAGLNLDSSGVSMFINGLARMRTTDKATQEYLNYFSERGLDVYDALSRSTGADKSAIAGMVSKGSISGSDAAQAILDYIREEFGGLSEKLAATYDAMTDNLSDAEANLNAMMGESYNQARKEGIREQSDWLESDRLEEAYSAIGAWKAELENARERYVREAVDEAMGSEAYQTAQAEGDAAEMGRIIMQAKIRGMGEYNANEGRDEALAQELALIEGVREDTALNQGYWDAGYTLGQAFSRGRAAAMLDEGVFQMEGDAVGTDASGKIYNDATGQWERYGSHAAGLRRVPRDNYAAMLHEGERVLTAREAREQDGGGTARNLTVSVTGNTFGAGMDAEAVAEAIADQVALQLAAGNRG